MYTEIVMISPEFRKSIRYLLLPYLIYFIAPFTHQSSFDFRLFLLTNFEFYRSIPCARDRNDFLLNVESRWDHRIDDISLPAVFKAYKPRGSNDYGHLNSQVLVFLSAVCTYHDMNGYTGNNKVDPIDHFLIECLADTVLNLRVYSEYCRLKNLKRSQLSEYLIMLRCNQDLIDNYILYDRFALIADFFVSLYFSLSLQVLLFYFNLITQPLAYLNDPPQFIAFLLLNIIAGRFIYNNFLYY